MVDAIASLMSRGGMVMWPLLGLSLLSVTLILERAWFFFRLAGRRRTERLRRLSQALRRGDRATADELARAEHSVYGGVIRDLLERKVIDEAAALDAIEQRRHRLERFLPTLSTVITAAPMLGILGTVLGIISSFEVLGDPSASRDPSLVGRGIAEALITTAAGLVVALVTLLPYNLIRARADRALGQLESLAAAAVGPTSETNCSEAGTSAS